MNHNELTQVNNALLDNFSVFHSGTVKLVGPPRGKLMPRALLYADDCVYEPATGLNWHVIKAASGKERTVAEKLEEHDIETFCPMRAVTHIVRNKLTDQHVALFSNYLFARWESGNAYSWHQVMDTTGVLEILGGDDPSTIDDELVDKWIEKVDSDDILQDADLLEVMADIRRGWKVGQYVFCRGAYVGHRMLVTQVDDDLQVVHLEISLLGRPIVIVRRISECEYAGVPEELPTATGRTSRQSLRKRGKRGGHRARLVKAFRDRRRRRR